MIENVDNFDNVDIIFTAAAAADYVVLGQKSNKQLYSVISWRIKVSLEMQLLLFSYG